MQASTILAMVNRVPFVPFRVHVSDGVSYDVMRAHMCQVGGTATFIGVSRHDSDSPLWDEPVIVANVHITRLEPLVDEVAAH